MVVVIVVSRAFFIGCNSDVSTVAVGMIMVIGREIFSDCYVISVKLQSIR